MERKILVKPFMDLVKAELDVPLRCEVVPEEEQFSAETDSYNATAVFSFSEETGSLRCAIYPYNQPPFPSLFGFSQPGPVRVRLTTGLELKADAYGGGPSLMRPSYFAHIRPEWHGDLGRVHIKDFQIGNKLFSWSRFAIGLRFPDTSNIPRNVNVNTP